MFSHVSRGNYVDVILFFVTYDTAMGDETAEVQSAVAARSSLKSLLDNLVAAQLSLLDGLIDANHVLPDNATGTNVQMANLGVSHEALGKSNSQRRGIELSVTVGVGGELVHDRGLGGSNGVAILGALGRGNTPAINDDCKSAKEAVLAKQARGRRGLWKRRGSNPAA